jgi:Flp pilus assembly protein TadD
LRQAARLDGEGKCAEAEPIYQRALARGTPSPALLNNTGNHYLVCGEPEKARDYFERLIRASPSHANANLQLAKMAVERKRTAEATAYLRALAVHSDPELLAQVGALYARLGEFRLAQGIFQRVAAARPGDFEAVWNLGRAAARAGDLSRARSALEAALRIRPDDPQALMEQGLANAASGDFPRAVYLLAQAQSKAPDQPGIALALARAAEDAGYYGDSAIAYDRYLQLKPGDEAARRDRARALANTIGRRAEGLKQLEDYVTRHPRDPIGLFHAAQFCWNTDAEKSLAHLAEAVRLDPRFAAAHTARAWLLHRLGRDSEALGHLEAALAVVPGDVRTLDQYALVLLSLDRPKEGERALLKAAALAPKDWEVRLHLGRNLMEQGREEEARVWLDEYQKLRPARQRDPRREPGMIELATLSAADRRAREIERFRSMARARPDDAVLQMHLGSLLLADGQIEEAGREFRVLLGMNADAATWGQAGRALLDAGQYELARALLERAGARLDLAIALLQTSGPEAALQALDQVLPDDRTSDVLLLKARILDGAGRAAEAQQLLADGLAGNVPRPRVAEQAALLLAKYGRYREAEELLKKGVAVAPGDGGLLLSEAIVAALDNRAAEAQQKLKGIEEQWPEWDRPYVVHGLLLASTARPQEALQKFRTAAALGSTDEAVACALGTKKAGAPCSCRVRLREWLFAACGERGQ